MLLGIDHGLKRKIVVGTPWKPVLDVLLTHGCMTGFTLLRVTFLFMKMGVGAQAMEMKMSSKWSMEKTESSHDHYKIGTRTSQ